MVLDENLRAVKEAHFEMGSLEVKVAEAAHLKEVQHEKRNEIEEFPVLEEVVVLHHDLELAVEQYSVDLQKGAVHHISNQFHRAHLNLQGLSEV